MLVADDCKSFGSEWLPSESVVLYHTDLLSSLINKLTELLGTIDNFGLVRILLSNLLSDFRVLPRSRHVELSSSFELLFSFDVGVIDPLSVGKWQSRSHGDGPLLECFDFLVGESAIENFKVIAG